MFGFIKREQAAKNDEIRKLQAEKEKLEADLAYVAMMTDVEIDEVTNDAEIEDV